MTDIVGAIDAVIWDYEVGPDAVRYLPYRPATAAERGTARHLAHLTGLDGYAALAVAQAAARGEDLSYRGELDWVVAERHADTVAEAVRVYVIQATERMREPLEQIQFAFASYLREMAQAVNDTLDVLMRHGLDKSIMIPPKNGPYRPGPGYRAYRGGRSTPTPRARR